MGKKPTFCIMLRKEKSLNQEGAAARVAKGIEPLVGSMGLELVDVELVKEGPRWYLRVYIDRPQGIDLNTCQQVSRQVEAWLDTHDLVKQTYTLEVSSPGLERSLKKEADFVKYKGRKVAITTFTPVEGIKEFGGELVGIEDGLVIVKNKDVVRKIPYKMVSSARLTFDFKTE